MARAASLRDEALLRCRCRVHRTESLSSVVSAPCPDEGLCCSTADNEQFFGGVVSPRSSFHLHRRACTPTARAQRADCCTCWRKRVGTDGQFAFSPIQHGAGRVGTLQWWRVAGFGGAHFCPARQLAVCFCSRPPSHRGLKPPVRRFGRRNHLMCENANQPEIFLSRNARCTRPGMLDVQAVTLIRR